MNTRHILVIHSAALIVIAVVALFSTTGCFITAPYVDAYNMQADMKTIQDRQRITTAFRSNPDTDGWYDSRQQMANALGDRDYNVNFSRAFDSLMVAISSMEISVKNIERKSGYISAEGLSLTPSESKSIRQEMVRQWARENGFDPSSLDRPLTSSHMASYGEMMDMNGMMSTYDKMLKSVTFQLVKLEDDRTRVKARFANVYYPDEMEQYYKRVWQEVDKQIFKDTNIEGEAVEKRN